MNLITRSIEKSPVINFRSFQYSKLREIIALSLRYLFKFGFDYDPKIYNPDGSDIEFIDDVTYGGFNHFSTKLIKVSLFKSKPFITTSIPELYQDIFFILNGTKYIPMCYIVDEPIIIKKNSIMISSLFQSITVYTKDNRVVFMRSNIVLEEFIKIITETWDNSYKKEIENRFNINLSSPINKQVIVNLSKKLNCSIDLIDIRKKINDLFFDEYTVRLYKKFYGIDNNLEDVFKKMFEKRQKTRVAFGDLRYKRLAFLEIILSPFLKAIGYAANILISNKFQRPSIPINLNAIVKHFFKELHSECLYDTVNGFSSLLAHKATFQNPFSTTGLLPTEVSEIHWTHKNRIDITSISNHEPGQTVFLVPNQQIDLDFGIFQFTKEEYRRPS